MIISEKQIIQLMECAQHLINLVRCWNDGDNVSSENALRLLDEIKNQQSTELREVKE